MGAEQENLDTNTRSGDAFLAGATLTGRENLSAYIDQELTIYRLRTDMIVPNPNQPRKTFIASEISALARTMKEDGAQQPIEVEPYLGGKVIIRGGERRWRAAQEAGIETIPCIFYNNNLDFVQLQENQIRQNYAHAKMGYAETGRAIKACMTRSGQTDIKEACKDFNLAENTVKICLAITDLPIELQNKVDENLLNIKDGLILIKLNEDPANQMKVAQLFIAGDKAAGMALYNDLVKPTKSTPINTRSKQANNRSVIADNVRSSRTFRKSERPSRVSSPADSKRSEQVETTNSKSNNHDASSHCWTLNIQGVEITIKSVNSVPLDLKKLQQIAIKIHDSASDHYS